MSVDCWHAISLHTGGGGWSPRSFKHVGSLPGTGLLPTAWCIVGNYHTVRASWTVCRDQRNSKKWALHDCKIVSWIYFVCCVILYYFMVYVLCHIVLFYFVLLYVHVCSYMVVCFCVCVHVCLSAFVYICIYRHIFCVCACMGRWMDVYRDEHIYKFVIGVDYTCLDRSFQDFQNELFCVAQFCG